MQRSPILLSLLLLVGLAGCSDSSSQGEVNGTVTLDGQPLKDGDVRFVPVDGKSPTTSAKITDGKFTATVPIGLKRVEFSAGKVIGKIKMYDTPESRVVDDIREQIPARYNTKSELKITVKKGSQDETFALKSK